MYDGSKLLPKSQFEKLLKLFPEPRQKKEGRKRISKQVVLTSILQVLINGVAWKKIADCGCSYVVCWRYLEELQRRGKLHLIFKQLVKEKTNPTISAIDTTLVTSFRFRKLTGWSGKHKKIGTKISLLSDKDGYPVDVLFGKGSDRDSVFVRRHLENVAGTRIKILNLDMLYTSLALRRALRRKGIRINMQTRRQDYVHKRGRKFRYDKKIAAVRFELERLNGWIKAFRALRARRSTRPALFKALVYMALIIVLIRKS